MNNDYLRVNSKDDETDIVASECGTPGQPNIVQSENKTEKLTLFSLFNVKRDSSASKIGFLDAKGLFSVFMIMLSFTLLMYLISVVASSIIFLFLAAFVTSFGMPICLVVFFFELNPMRNVKVGEICAGVAVGALYFCVSKLCKVSIESFSTITSMLPTLILNAIDDLLLFFISLIFAKVSKKDCLFGTILIVVCIYSGYIITDTFTKLVNGMFISVNDPMTGKSIMAIVDDITAFKDIFRKFFGVLMYEGVLMTFLTCIWSVISGALISVMTAPLKNNSYSNASIYSILFLTIIMHAAISMSYAVKYLGLLINVIVIGLSVFLALKLLNYCIMRTNFSVDQK